MGPISEQRLAQVHPTLSALIHQLATMMSEPIGVTQGLRNEAEQEAYFAQGRQSLDAVNALRATANLPAITEEENQRPVTNAPPGYSYHEYGLACDVVPDSIDTGEPDWDPRHPVWNEIVTKGEQLGLTSGIEWHDLPHLQWTCQYPASPTLELRQLLKNAGLQAVWSSLVPGDGQ